MVWTASLGWGAHPISCTAALWRHRVPLAEWPLFMLPFWSNGSLQASSYSMRYQTLQKSPWYFSIAQRRNKAKQQLQYEKKFRERKYIKVYKTKRILPLSILYILVVGNTNGGNSKKKNKIIKSDTDQLSKSWCSQCMGSRIASCRAPEIHFLAARK